MGAGPVDIFKELFDIARWLPAIAADSDLPKEPWDRINAASQRLAVQLRSVESSDHPQQREQYLAASNQIQAILQELQSIAEAEREYFMNPWSNPQFIDEEPDRGHGN